MNLKYYGLSCFQFKMGETVLVTDPFDPKELGISLPSMEADVVLYTQPRSNVTAGARKKITASGTREERGTGLFEIVEPGEYEVGGIYIKKLHNSGVAVITMDEVNVCYLGMAKKINSSMKFDDLGSIHYLIIPVGDGDEFLDWRRVNSLIKDIDPGVVIPSCYRMEGMKDDYKKLHSLKEYLKEAGAGGVSEEKKLKLQPLVMSDETQYKIVTLERSQS